jgi:2-hydroxycyclohexanecarboxyl-CoA dehydrogenase
MGMKPHAPGLSDTAQPRVEMGDNELYAAGAKIPLGRIGQPQDIAAVVAFLLSDDAGYMTGQSVAVNGGAIMVP